MTHAWVFRKVMREHHNGGNEVLPPIEEWDMNLEVGSQVYQSLKDFKQLEDMYLWADNTPLLNMGGF